MGGSRGPSSRKKLAGGTPEARIPSVRGRLRSEVVVASSLSAVAGPGSRRRNRRGRRAQWSEKKRQRARAYFDRRYSRARQRRTFWNSAFGCYMMWVYRENRHIFGSCASRKLRESAGVQWELLSREGREPWWAESRRLRRAGEQAYGAPEPRCGPFYQFRLLREAAKKRLDRALQVLRSVPTRSEVVAPPPLALPVRSVEEPQCSSVVVETVHSQTFSRFADLRRPLLSRSQRIQVAERDLLRRYVGRWARSWGKKGRRVFRRVKSSDLVCFDDLARTAEGDDIEVAISEASESESD